MPVQPSIPADNLAKAFKDMRERGDLTDFEIRHSAFNLARPF
jgi:hypothetical protein